MIRRVLCTSLALGIVLIAGCATPGKGQKAESGYALLEPVIRALDKFYEKNGAYPEKLQELVPKYVSKVPESFDDWPIVYFRETPRSAEVTSVKYPGYLLSFKYTGPGMNQCFFRPGEQWDCSG